MPELPLPRLASDRASPVRLAELMMALSLATDLGMGQPLEFAWQACALATRLGEKLGFDENALREVYYQALLRYIGCNAETHLLAAVFGDELALRSDIIHADGERRLRPFLPRPESWPLPMCTRR